MEDDNMFQNSSEQLASNKLLILYIMNKMNVDLTNSQITQIVLETEVMNYFSFQQFLSELIESKFLNIYKEDDREYYRLTQRGLEMLEYFLPKVNDNSLKINDYIKKNKERILSETEVKATFKKENEREFIVNLRVIENNSDLINLNVNVSSEKQAMLICKNWKNNASYIYAEIIQSLISENH